MNLLQDLDAKMKQLSTDPALMNFSPLPKAIIFDIDGTLLDSMHIWHDSANLYLESMGIHEEKDLGPVLFTATIESASKFLKETYNLPCSEEEIRKGVLDITRNFYKNDAQLKEGVREFLEICKKSEIKMVVASSGVKELFIQAFRRLEIEEYFSAIYSDVNKHEVENFEKIAKDLGEKKEDIWVFEDALHASISAKKAGLNLCAIYDKESRCNWEELKKIADFTIEDWRNVDSKRQG